MQPFFFFFGLEIVRRHCYPRCPLLRRRGRLQCRPRCSPATGPVVSPVWIAVPGCGLEWNSTPAGSFRSSLQAPVLPSNRGWARFQLLMFADGHRWANSVTSREMKTALRVRQVEKALAQERSYSREKRSMIERFFQESRSIRERVVLHNHFSRVT